MDRVDRFLGELTGSERAYARDQIISQLGEDDLRSTLNKFLVEVRKQDRRSALDEFLRHLSDEERSHALTMLGQNGPQQTNTTSNKSTQTLFMIVLFAVAVILSVLSILWGR